MRRVLIPALAGALVSLALVGVPLSSAQGSNKACANLDSPCKVMLSTGIKMAYIESGPASGNVLILLHGLTDSKRSWSRAMPILHKMDPSLHIYALDQRGHGASSRPKTPTCVRHPAQCFDMQLMASDVLAFMDAMGVARATVAGHSMGSIVTQELLTNYPDRLDGAILVATAASVKGNPVVKDWLLDGTILGSWKPAVEAQGYSWPTDIIKLTPYDSQPRPVEWMKANWDVDPIAPASFTTPIAKETARVRLQTWLGATKAIGVFDNVDGLRHDAVPTLVLWGTQDSFFYKSDQDLVIKSLKSAARKGGSFCWKQYGVVPLDPSGYQTDDLGHNLQWEAPAQVATDILHFMSTGKPTKDLYHTDLPSDVHRIVTEPGKAVRICA